MDILALMEKINDGRSRIESGDADGAISRLGAVIDELSSREREGNERLCLAFAYESRAMAYERCFSNAPDDDSLRQAYLDFSTALQFYSDFGDSELAEVACLEGLGRIEMHERQFAEAANYFEQAFAIHMRYGQTREAGEAAFRSAQAWIDMELGKPARFALEQSIILFGESESPDRAAEAYLLLGKIEIRSQRGLPAYRALESGLAAAEAAGRPDLAATSLEHLTSVHLSSGDAEAARDAMDRRVSHMMAEENEATTRIELLVALWTLATVHRAFGEVDEFLRLRAEVAALSDQVDGDVDTARAQLYLAALECLDSTDDRAYLAAEAWHETYVGSALRRGGPNVAVEVSQAWTRIGELRVGRGDLPGAERALLAAIETLGKDPDLSPDRIVLWNSVIALRRQRKKVFSYTRAQFAQQKEIDLRNRWAQCWMP